MRNKQCFLCFAVYNTFQNATVILTIEDRNDNAPQFIYPQYPGQLLNRNLYVGAISINAPAGSNVLSIYVSLPNVTINYQMFSHCLLYCQLLKKRGFCIGIQGSPPLKATMCGYCFHSCIYGGSLHLEIISQIGKKLMNMIDSYDDG